MTRIIIVSSLLKSNILISAFYKDLGNVPIEFEEAQHHKGPLIIEASTWMGDRLRILGAVFFIK